MAVAVTGLHDFFKVVVNPPLQFFKWWGKLHAESYGLHMQLHSACMHASNHMFPMECGMRAALFVYVYHLMACKCVCKARRAR